MAARHRGDAGALRRTQRGPRIYDATGANPTYDTRAPLAAQRWLHGAYHHRPATLCVGRNPALATYARRFGVRGRDSLRRKWAGKGAAGAGIGLRILR